MIELLVDGDVDEFVDCGRDNGAAEPPIIRGQIAPAADEAHSQRSSADDHLIAPGRLLVLVRLVISQRAKASR